ncbi:MAG: hypothetical protein F6K00_01545 [Leptolyngbya sp. SIOISBB]|nr:hypothetical protein [Leptolyngbya sp. SIOISBB]
MTVQPTYHWQFNERKGSVARDAIGGVEGRLHRSIVWHRHGRIGNAVRLPSRESRLVFGPEVGQFGTSDFTVAFGLKIMGTDGQNDLDIIGTRSMSGHGNWFSLRLEDKGRRLTFEVDENSKGKNYAFAKTPRLPNLFDKKWHHITLVRAGRTIEVYLDGVLVAAGAAKTGVANIKRAVDVKLGHYTRHTPIAHYEDLRIYHTALTTEQIQALIPPINRPLSAGEIELVATDEAAVVLKQDVADLAPFSGHFKELRLGPDTGATLYKGTDFKNVAQKLYADIPDIRFTKLGDFPRSVRIWSTVGEPFIGQWIIQAPNGLFLHRGKTRLQTASQQFSNGLFKFHYNLQQARLQLLPGADKDNALFTLSAVETPASLFVDDSESLPGEFSLINQGADEWLELVAGNTFHWTRQKDKRAVFVRAVKFADNEGQVGELAQGEVALYEHRAYHGKTWILSDSAKIALGEHKSLGDFGGLNDRTSSIRLGPDTGVTLFKHFNYRVAEDKREEEIEDIVKNVPDLKESQIGDDALSSVKIFRTIAAEDVFASYTTKLSQDYRMVNDKLEEFSAYRTTLRFEAGAGAVEVAATDLTTIEVDGITYEIDETRSATLTPNDLNFIMITSEADGLNTPGLKIQTSEMADNEQVVIFPNQEAHQQIAELEDGALWNAKDAQGNLIVDRTAHSQAEVASVQNTIKRVTATVTYADKAPVAKPGGGSRVLSSERVVSGAAIDQPWELKFKPEPDEGDRRQTQAQSAILKSRGLVAASVAANRPEDGDIGEATVSQDDFARLLNQATSSEAAPISEPAGKETQLPGAIGFGGARRIGGIKRLRIGRRIRNAIKKAKSVVVGAVKGVVHFVIKTATEVIDFVVDTVEKVGEFIEAVVEKVVNGIKKFIEFLQFLFDWGDILDTQRYLKRTINAGFDAATQLAASAKQPVSDFIGDLQDSVEDGMNNLVKLLGGTPSEAETFEFKLPEAAEWFLSKLFGGAQQDDANPIPNAATNQNDDSPISTFMSTLLEAGEDVIGMALRAFEGLTEAITALVTNPLKPQLALIAIIEALRDVVIQFLDLIETLAHGFLDIVGAAVQQLKDLINAPINIPFISALFKLLGAGDLSIINVTTLLLAIPITVISKLAFGKKPFQGTATPDFVALSQPGPAALSARSLSVSQSQAEASENSEAAEDTEETSGPDLQSIKDDVRSFGIAQLTLDAFSGILTTILDATAISGKKIGSDRDSQSSQGSSSGKGKKFISFFEVVSILVDHLSWQCSFVTFTLLADADDNSAAAKKVERRERGMQIYRLIVLFADTIVTLGSSSQGSKRRMKRHEQNVTVIFTLLSVLDLIITSVYLAALPKEDGRGLAIANEIVALLPDLLSPLRLSGPKGQLALVVVTGTATAVTLGMGSKLLANDLDELQEAIQGA